MQSSRDHIDPDEGRDFPAPERQYCGSCDRELLSGEECFPCYWEPSIEVGPCCFVHSDQEPLCSAALEIVLTAKSVHQLAHEIRLHCSSCTYCGQQPVMFQPVQPEEEPEPECSCVPIDVDFVDSRHCLLHGPHSEAYRLELEEEAAFEAEYYRQPKFEPRGLQAEPARKDSDVEKIA